MSHGYSSLRGVPARYGYGRGYDPSAVNAVPGLKELRNSITRVQLLACSAGGSAQPLNVCVHACGSGKTLLASAVAKHFEDHKDILAHVVFVRCSKLAVEKLQSVRQGLANYISEALDHSPSLVIFDDLDNVLSSSSEPEASPASNAVISVAEFLSDVIDEFRLMEIIPVDHLQDKRKSSCGIGPVAFMATARSLGRFDFHLQLSAPAAAERGAILKHELHRRALLCSEDVLEDIAAKCDGYDAYDLYWKEQCFYKDNSSYSCLLYDKDNSIVMSWIMNSVQTDIAPTLAYYTTAKHMWTFLRQTYSHDKNVSKILQVEEELLKLQQGELELSPYFASVKAAYERLKALRPPCQACYKMHFEQTMVAKFLAGLSPKYEVAKVQMLTGAEIPDLAEAYNRLSILAVSLSQSQSESPSTALAVSGGRGQATRGRGSGRGVGGRGRFQCTLCGKLRHLEDRCWDKHGRPASTSHGRGGSTSGGTGTFSSRIPVGSARVATPLGETPSSMNSENPTVTMSKAEFHDPPLVYTRRHTPAQDCPPVASQDSRRMRSIGVFLRDLAIRVFHAAALGSVPLPPRDPCTPLPWDPCRHRLGFHTIASGSVQPSPREPCHHRLGIHAVA
ncbi:Peroxisome biogenesis protein 1 [Nymphaea thermarum]|nr:Peroxisome biogenesis protein 1 [Nymphaea thermarum]